MAKPSSRQELIDYCLRQLGEPVLEINVDDDQIEDAVDDAIQFFHERHFDGVEKMYLKHKITQDMIDAARSNTVATTGISSDKFDGSSASIVSVSADNITIPNHGLVTGSPIEYSFGPGNTTIAIASATLDGAGVTTALGMVRTVRNFMRLQIIETRLDWLQLLPTQRLRLHLTSLQSVLDLHIS